MSSQPNRPPYIIVQGDAPDDLVKHVTDAIRDGYRPCGGAYYGEVPGDHQWRTQYLHNEHMAHLQPMLHKDVQ